MSETEEPEEQPEEWTGERPEVPPTFPFSAMDLVAIAMILFLASLFGFSVGWWLGEAIRMAIRLWGAAS